MLSKTTENQFDAYCKKVLRFKSIAATILHDTIDEFKDTPIHEIMNILNKDNLNDRMNVLNVEDITKSNSKIFYDLLFHIQFEDGMFIDLEPQGKISKMESFIKRCIHTGARMIVWQRNEKDGSFKEDYSDLKKCISIWILLNPPKEYKGKVINIDFNSNHEYCTEFKSAINTERIIIMCLHDQIDITDKSALMMLSILFSSKLNKTQREFILKEEYGILLTEAEREELNHMCNAHEGVLEYGKEIGIDIGMKNKSIEIAKKMITRGCNLDFIMDLTCLSIDQIEKLAIDLRS